MCHLPVCKSIPTKSVLLKGFVVGRKSSVLMLHHAASSDFVENHEGDIRVVFCFLFRQEVEF